MKELLGRLKEARKNADEAILLRRQLTDEAKTARREFLMSQVDKFKVYCEMHSWGKPSPSMFKLDWYMPNWINARALGISDSKDRYRFDELYRERLNEGMTAALALKNCRRLDHKIVNLVPEGQWYKFFKLTTNIQDKL